MITTLEQLEEHLSRPTSGVLETLKKINGDLLILGAGGKMGVSLSRMVQRGIEALSQRRRVIAVSRFSSPAAAAELQQHGVETISCDLTDREAVAKLPEIPNVIFMAGHKFGTQAAPEMTWISNTLVPAIVAERFTRSRIVAFSTGCVYPLVSTAGHGSREDDRLDPPGEYANSCVGRERMFTHFSKQHGTEVLLFRLNYAIDLRYGVLHDIAQKVNQGLPVDVTMGWVNVIWQGDANARAIQSLAYTQSPPSVLNVTGKPQVSVRSLAERLGELLGRKPIITGTESPTAWLSDATRSFELFGPVTVSLDEMLELTARWVQAGGTSLGKPTKFESRDGHF